MSDKGPGSGCLRITVIVLAALAVVLAVTFLWVLPSQRKTYSLDAVDISAAVQTDGSLVTNERLSYTFHGAFTRVYRDIPFEGSQITVLGVDGPDGPLQRLPSGWTPAQGSPTTVSPQHDVTPSPWSSLAPAERPAGFYRVTYASDPNMGAVVRIEAFADLSDRAAEFTFHWRAADAAQR